MAGFVWGRYGVEMSVDIPTPKDFAELTEHRGAASVTIYLSAAATGSRAIAHGADAVKVALRSALHNALAELGRAELSRDDHDQISAHVKELEFDHSFWGTGARSIALFVSPQRLQAFRLMNELDATWSTGDRYDVGPMLRAVTFAHTGYVLALAAGKVRLLHLDAAATHTAVDLPDLPDDIFEVMTRDPAVGRFNRHRAEGTLGPKPEQKRFATLVQDAVLTAIGDPDTPLVLAATTELDPAYREINTHGRLLDAGIHANPASLSDEDLERRARELLDDHYRQRISNWVETFGTRQANGKGSAQLSEVAQAAWAGRVSELLFDINAAQEGTIDEFGNLELVTEAGPTTYRVVDEIATQVLRNGGKVRAVRADDLPDDAVVAAIFRS